MINLFNREI